MTNRSVVLLHWKEKNPHFVLKREPVTFLCYCVLTVVLNCDLVLCHWKWEVPETLWKDTNLQDLFQKSSCVQLRLFWYDIDNRYLKARRRWEGLKLIWIFVFVEEFLFTLVSVMYTLYTQAVLTSTICHNTWLKMFKGCGSFLWSFTVLCNFLFLGHLNIWKV